MLKKSIIITGCSVLLVLVILTAWQLLFAEDKGIMQSKDVLAATTTQTKEGANKTMTFTNPIKFTEMPHSTGFRDPFIVCIGDTYYLIGTKYDYGQGSDGVDLYSSKDLENWKFEANLITKPKLSDSKWYNYFFWAPELFMSNGKYYLTVNCSRDTGSKQVQEVALLVSDNIRGPYTMISEYDSVVAGNDASFFTDDDGKTYIFLSDITGAEIDLRNGQIIGEKFDVVRANPEGGKFDSVGVEGPCVVKRDGIYYCFYSAWTRGYEVGYATAKNIRGPWTRHSDPIYGGLNIDWINRHNNQFSWNMKYDKSYYSHPYKEVGHNSVFRAQNGKSYIVAHVYDSTPGVKMAIDEIKFENGKVTIVGAKNNRGPVHGKHTMVCTDTSNDKPKKAINIYETVVINSEYSLPTKAYLLMQDGQRLQYNVKWEGCIDSSKDEKQTIDGNILYKGKKFPIKLTVNIIKPTTLEDMTAYIQLGEKYTLPKYVKVKFSNGYTLDYGVEWSGTLDTGKVGTQELAGEVKDLGMKVKLTANVTKKRILIENFDNGSENSKLTRLAIPDANGVKLSNNEFELIEKEDGTVPWMAAGFWESMRNDYTFSCDVKLNESGKWVYMGVRSTYPAAIVSADGGIWFALDAQTNQVKVVIGAPGNIKECAAEASFDITKLPLDYKTYDIVNTKNVVKFYVNLDGKRELLSTVKISSDSKTAVVLNDKGKIVQTLTFEKAIPSEGYSAVFFEYAKGACDNLTLNIK